MVSVFNFLSGLIESLKTGKLYLPHKLKVLSLFDRLISVVHESLLIVISAWLTVELFHHSSTNI